MLKPVTDLAALLTGDSRMMCPHILTTAPSRTYPFMPLHHRMRCLVLALI